MTGWKAYLGAAILVLDALSGILHQLAGIGPTVAGQIPVALLGMGLGVAGIRHKQERTLGADPAEAQSLVSTAIKAVTPS